LIRSIDLPRVLKRLRDKVVELHIEKEEIKWQKVNKHMFEPYMELVNLIFDLLDEDLSRYAFSSVITSMCLSI